MLSSGHVERTIAGNFTANSGAYRPSPRTLLNIPKTNFTLRYGLETSLPDRAVYHGIAAFLIPFYDPLIPWNVFNHRAATGSAANRYIFQRPVPAWQDFTGVVRDAVGERPVLLSTDLANYFENINLDVLRRTLEDLISNMDASPSEKAQVRSHIALLFECLLDWCFSPQRGLPQNRDASSFLANIYMLPIDLEMLARGHRYFRYMDDIKIACESTFAARRALKELTLLLRDRGLSVNSGKTHIVEPTDAELLHQCLDMDQGELQELDAVWQTRTLEVIRRSFTRLSDLTLRLLRAGDVSSRPFRYCIRRLEALASCPEFAVPEPYFSVITPLVIEALANHPAATDELVRYLRAVPTSDADLGRIEAHLLDAQRNFYTWQSYRLWHLLTAKSYRSDPLMEHARGVVRLGADDANRWGATLYLGALGSQEDRVLVAQHFRAAQSFMGQRAALVAVQELHYRPHVRDHIQPYLRHDLQNVYRSLRQEGSPIYVAPLERRSITRFVDVERSYD